MKLLVALAPQRYRDEELDEPLAIFREHAITWDVASVQKGTCTGMLGGHAVATLGFSEADPSAYDGIVIVGGAGSPPHLWGDHDLTRLVMAFSAAGKPVAAICLSPVVLARTGILKGKKATVFRSPDAVSEMKNGGALLTNLPVVADGNVITADGPGAARAFGIAIAAALSR